MTDLSARLRRRTLTWFAALPALIAVSTGTRAQAQPRAALPPTPADAEGPFYPTRIPADADADLTRVAGNAGRAQGTPLQVSGRVRDTNGSPLAGTKVELWQCDSRGLYHHVGGD